MIKLRELPRDKGIIIKGFKDDKNNDVDIVFHYIDGSYSYCTIGSNVVHLSASTPLEKISDGVYKLSC